MPTILMAALLVGGCSPGEDRPAPMAGLWQGDLSSPDFSWPSPFA